MHVEEMIARLRAFDRSRDWSKFHTPKNLAISLSIEAAELLEVFRWLTDDESAKVGSDAKDLARVEEELADVLIQVLRLADTLHIDIQEAFEAKLALDAKHYPVDVARGSAKKYSDR